MWDFVTHKLIDLDYSSPSGWALFYRWFNVIEAAAWFGIGLWVLARYARFRKSPLEFVYCLLFMLFALTDIREVSDLPVWLLIAKGVVLAGLIGVRLVLKRRYYPDIKI